MLNNKAFYTSNITSLLVTESTVARFINLHRLTKVEFIEGVQRQCRKNSEAYRRVPLARYPQLIRLRVLPSRLIRGPIMKTVAVFAAFVLIGLGNVHETESKVFTKCGLTKELLNNGFERTYVGHWVCLVESESAKNTSKVTDKADRSKSLGLFQINSKEWCKFSTAGGKCSMKCEDLLDEDIRDDSVCAKKIQRALGFRAWDGWFRSCYRRNLSIPPC
ncbi:lysozyme-like isoform X2 [Rhynchophorus ferrugineus]|uniref:lysozyme-like isoform X2 n=1 Tax=Rhynchophorus ferrugineus TaxID=354439 RepID=UPI003FCC54E4